MDTNTRRFDQPQDAVPQTDTSIVPASGSTLNAKERIDAPSRFRAKQIAMQLRFTDAMAITNFGVQAQSQLGSVTEQIISRVATKDAGPAGPLLSELLNQTSALKPQVLLSGGGVSRLPIIGGLFDAARGFIDQYQTVEAKLKTIVAQLEVARNNMSRDITRLDELYDENMRYLQELLVYIYAGDLALQRVQTRIDELTTTAQRTGDQMDAQAVADARNQQVQLERRVHDLKLLAVVALQTAPQIRLIQSGDQALHQKITQSITTTIPLWKQQIALAITMHRQRQALEQQKKVTETTDQLLRANAQMLHTGAVEIARETERGIVSIETLTQTHELLKQTITETVQIYEQGRQQRAQNEQVINQIAGETVDILTNPTGSSTPQLK